jgi:hypothetical protein
MHKPYQDKLGHIADFKVEYQFYTASEGGRNLIPFQGYRSDFFYEHPKHSGLFQIFMIWPEFENEGGEVILDNTTSVSPSGVARMWIIDSERRAYHVGKIKIGLRGYFMEGSRRVAECKVIELLGLETNSK